MRYRTILDVPRFPLNFRVSFVASCVDISGCVPCYALIEYAYDLNLPDSVIEHPSLKEMKDAATDFISLVNVSITDASLIRNALLIRILMLFSAQDLCSYAKEHRSSKHSTSSLPLHVRR